MRILDHYISSSIYKIFLAAVLVFCLLFILGDAAGLLDELLDQKVSFRVILQYYLYYIPLIFVQTSSMACLVATLFTFSTLNNNNEIIVMRTAGLTFWQITKPALIFGLIISAVIFWTSERIVPTATLLTKKVKYDHMTGKTKAEKLKAEKIEGLTFYGLKNRLYYIDTYSPTSEEMDGVTMLEYDGNQNIKRKIVCLKGKWASLAWKFFQCQITNYSEQGPNETVNFEVDDEKLMDIQETPQDFLTQRLDMNSMNIRQLQDYINRFSNSGANRAINNLRVDLYQKFASPFQNFVIVLLGIPFALMIHSRRRSTFTSLGIAFLIGFLYHVLNSVAVAFGKGGLLSPLIAAWLAPAITTFLAVYFIETNF